MILWSRLLYNWQWVKWRWDQSGITSLSTECRRLHFSDQLTPHHFYRKNIFNICRAHSIPADYGAFSAETRPLEGYKSPHKLKERGREVKAGWSGNLPWVKYLKSTTNFTYSYIRGSFGSKLPLAKWQQNSICFSAEMKESETNAMLPEIYTLAHSIYQIYLHVYTSPAAVVSEHNLLGMLLIPVSNCWLGRCCCPLWCWGCFLGERDILGVGQQPEAEIWMECSDRKAVA